MIQPTLGTPAKKKPPTSIKLILQWRTSKNDSGGAPKNDSEVDYYDGSFEDAGGHNALPSSSYISSVTLFIGMGATPVEL